MDFSRLPEDIRQSLKKTLDKIPSGERLRALSAILKMASRLRKRRLANGLQDD